MITITYNSSFMVACELTFLFQIPNKGRVAQIRTLTVFSFKKQTEKKNPLTNDDDDIQAKHLPKPARSQNRADWKIRKKKITLILAYGLGVGPSRSID